MNITKEGGVRDMITDLCDEFRLKDGSNVYCQSLEIRRSEKIWL